MAEALAARRAMVFARELSLFNVILEGDFLWVIQALIYLGRCNTLFGHIIDETKRIGDLLRQCKFRHVCREGNRLTHGLVRKVVLSVDTNV